MTSEKVVEVAEKALDTKDEPVKWGMVKIDASAPIVMTSHPAFQKRTWVGLTDEEIYEIAWPNGNETLQAIIKHSILQAEQLLKDKNT